MKLVLLIKKKTGNTMLYSASSKPIGQAITFYKEDLCLAGAQILAPGPSQKLIYRQS